MPQITNEGRLVKQVAAGARHVLCLGEYNGKTLLDEQRENLEKKIDKLEKQQQKEVKSDRSKSMKRKRRDVQQALEDAKKDKRRESQSKSKEK